MKLIDKVKWFVIGGIYTLTFYGIGLLTAQLF
jgi:hypothetical protein